MAEAERSIEAPGPDNGFTERAGCIPQALLDGVGIFVKNFRITPGDRKLLLDAGVEALSRGVPFTEVLDAALGANPAIFMVAARNALADLIPVREPWHLDLMVLIAAQPHLRPVLPDEICLNLAFAGSKSSGKTKATKVVTKLAGGRFFAGGSLAALRDRFGVGFVGLDEVDTQSKRLEDLEGILRTGNSWNATYPIKVPDGNAWKTEERNIGGPKVFNFRGKVDDALLSRCYLIDLPRRTGGLLVVSNLFPDRRILPLAGHLRRLCERAIRGLTKGEVERRMNDPAFIARLDGLPPGLARSQESAAILFALSDILGLDLEETIHKAAGAQAESDTEGEELRDYLLEFYEARRGDPSMPDLEVLQSELLAFANEKRRMAGPRPYAPNGAAFASALREAGFSPGKKKSSFGGRRFLRFDSEVRKRIGIEEENRPSSAAEPARSPILRFDEKTLTRQDGTVEERWTGRVLRSPGGES
ncbi:MAG: hypothetical protein WAN74_05910 [Thermoplasmata archaeon]